MVGERWTRTSGRRRDGNSCEVRGESEISSEIGELSSETKPAEIQLQAGQTQRPFCLALWLWTVAGISGQISLVAQTPAHGLA